MNYATLDTKLQGRNFESRKEGNNTYWKRRNDSIVLKYHETDVATFKPNGDIILNSGGWHTSTTKERINMAIGNRLSQVNGIWYLGGYRFQDGITLHADGSITGGLTETPNREKADKILKAKVKKYAQRCADSVPLNMPSAGDCWYCSMITDKGESMGDAFKDTSHLDSHIKENYVVPSLVLKALREAGNSDFILSLVFGQDNATTRLMAKMGTQDNIAKERVYKAVYRFIMKRKGYAI